MRITSLDELPESLRGNSAEEMETTISMQRGGEWATVYTADNAMYHRMLRMCRKAPDNYQPVSAEKIEGEVCCATFRVKAKLISMRVGNTKRELTPEQKAAMSERMKALVAKRKAGTISEDEEEELEEEE